MPLRFHLCLANHDPTGRRTLEDHCDWIQAGLLDLGHSVSISERTLERGAVNLIFEHFLPGQGERFRQLRRSGYTIGIIALENFDGGGFNGHRDAYWTARFQGFLEVAPSASFIWGGFPASESFYARFAPTSLLELGYSDRLLPTAPPAAPVHDVGFWGFMSPHRLEVLERLSRHTRVSIPRAFLTGRALQEYLASIKVGLLIRPSAAWTTTSQNRFGRLTHSGRATLSEHVPEATRGSGRLRVSPLIPMMRPGGDLLERLERLVAGRWRRSAAAARERYRNQAPMREIMAEILEASFPYSAGPPPGLSGSSSESTELDRMLDPALMFEYQGFNVVRVDDRLFCGARQSLGAFDMRMSVEELRLRFSRADLIFEECLDQLLWRIREASIYQELENRIDLTMPRRRGRNHRRTQRQRPHQRRSRRSRAPSGRARFRGSHRRR